MENERTSFNCNLLVIGGSAGSLKVIIKVLATLHANLSFPIVIVLHRNNSYQSVLVEVLSSKTTLIVSEAEDKDSLLPGHVYIAPADYHLLIEKDKSLSLDYSEKVNYSRPSIDATFEAAANVYRQNLACILLSGSNADGVQGLKFVENAGGLIIVQDPETAEAAFMPASAIEAVKVDYILSANEIADLINSF